MSREIKDFFQINDKDNLKSYQAIQNDKIHSVNIIKEGFKSSIAQWQCKKKIDNMIRKLQNKI